MSYAEKMHDPFHLVSFHPLKLAFDYVAFRQGRASTFIQDLQMLFWMAWSQLSFAL